MVSTRSAAILGIAFVAVFGTFWAVQAQTPDVTIRWLVAHQPAEVFERAQKAFAAEYGARIGKSVAIEFLTPEDLGFEDSVPPTTVLELLAARDVNLVSVNLDSLMSKETDLKVLHLPYLFKNYESAGRVLDGDVGARLLEATSALTGEQALAFTYSGGFRVIATNGPEIKMPADMKGLRITTWGGRIVQDNLRSLGAVPLQVAVNSGRAEMENGKSDGAEFTYTRATGVLGEAVKTVTETNHILFLSVIIAGGDFYNDLTPDERKALSEAAQIAAGIERTDSIAFADRIRAKLKSDGVSVMALTAEDRVSFEAWGKTVRAQFATSRAQKDLIDSILKIQE